MAKNTSLVKVRGTIDGMTFYRNRYGEIVQKKSSLSGDRIRTSPQFRRTRENMSEFSVVATAGKHFRRAVATIARRAYDPFLNQRMFSVCSKLKNLDSVNVRGQRLVSEGYDSAEGKLLMTGLELNGRASLSLIMSQTIDLDIATGTLSISQFSPMNHLLSPEGATHVRFTSAFLGVFWDSGEYEIHFSNEALIALDSPPDDVELVPSDLPALANAPLFYLLLLEFVQEVNGQYYNLSNGQFNVLQVIWAG